MCKSIKVSRGTAMESLDKWEEKRYHIYLHSTSKRNEDYVVVAKGTIGKSLNT